MTDTPPFYWLNGEDGPLEEEDENHKVNEKDVVLTAPRKLQNGLLEKLNLSRTLDRQRRTGVAAPEPGPGTVASFDGIVARDRCRQSMPTTPPVPATRSHSSSMPVRRMRTAPLEDVGVDISGMPGGGLRPPTPLKVQGLRPVMPANAEVVLPYPHAAPPGATVQTGLVAGMGAHAIATGNVMVGAGARQWSNQHYPHPYLGAAGVPQGAGPTLLGANPGMVGLLKMQGPAPGVAEMPAASSRHQRASTPTASAPSSFVAAARSPSTPPLSAPLRAGQGTAGSSWHWSEASGHMGSMRMPSLTRAREPSPSTGTRGLTSMEFSYAPVGSASTSLARDLSCMSSNCASHALARDLLQAPNSGAQGSSCIQSRGMAMRDAGSNLGLFTGHLTGQNLSYTPAVGNTEPVLQELPITFGAASSRGRQGSPLPSKPMSPSLWPRNATPPASPSSWKRRSEVGTHPGSFLLSTAHHEKSNSAPGSMSYHTGAGHWPSASQPFHARHTIDVVPNVSAYSSSYGMSGTGPAIAPWGSAPVSLTPGVTPGASYVPPTPPGTSLLSAGRVRPKDSSPQRSLFVESGDPALMLGLMPPAAVFPQQPNPVLAQMTLGAAKCAHLAAEQQGLAACDAPYTAMTSPLLDVDTTAASTGIGIFMENGLELEPITLQQRLPETPTWATSPECLSPELRSAQCAQPQVTAESIERPRVLVTGATGLLGRQVMKAFYDLELRGLCRSRGKPPMVCCDLTAEGVAAKEIEEFRPHIVIHLAGERRPDVLRRSPARARLLNVDASGAIAAACECVGSWLIMMSADAVFDGSSPPYANDDSPNPLSEYGWHKLHAEKLVLAACPGAAVLRVPMLYGGVEFAAESAVTGMYAELRTGATQMDNWQRCYPTWAPDVARVLRTLADMHLGGTDLNGIFHWQGDECFTRYDMACLMAEISRLDAPEASVENWSWSPVPEDARLDCSRLEDLLVCPMTGLRRYRTSFREGLGVCLAPFLDACRSIDQCQQAAGLYGSKDTKLVSDEILRDDEGDGKVLCETKQTNLHVEESSENCDPSLGPAVHVINGESKEQHYQELMNSLSYGLRASSNGTKARAPSKQRSSVKNDSAAWEERPEARAAALKTVFREELEHAWRRYRDAAQDGKHAKMKYNQVKQR